MDRHSIATRLPAKLAATSVELSKLPGIPPKLRRKINQAYGKSNKAKLLTAAKKGLSR